jgi:septum formation protein
MAGSPPGWPKAPSFSNASANLESGEWEGKAGGYAIQGRAAAYIRFMSGSYSNVVGLSLYDVTQLLAGQRFLGQGG